MVEDKKYEEVRGILNLEPEEQEGKKKLIIDSKNQVTFRVPSKFAIRAGLEKGEEVIVVLNLVMKKN